MDAARAEPALGDAPPPEMDVAAPSSAPSADDLSRLVESWGGVVDQINARSKSLASVFRNSEMVRPVAVSNRVCTIAFRDPFHARKTMTVPYQDIIETAFTRVLGYKCRLESVTFNQVETGSADEDPPSPGAGGRRAARDRPAPHETTRGKAAMNIFGFEKFDDT